MLRFDCPECGKNLKVHEENANRRLRCPECGQPITITGVIDDEDDAGSMPAPELEQVPEVPAAMPEKSPSQIPTQLAFPQPDFFQTIERPAIWASKGIGLALLVVGAVMLCFGLCCGFGSLMMEFTVEGNETGQRIYNMPAAHRQQMYLIASIGIDIVGIGLIGTGAFLVRSGHK